MAKNFITVSEVVTEKVYILNVDEICYVCNSGVKGDYTSFVKLKNGQVIHCYDHVTYFEGLIFGVSFR